MKNLCKNRCRLSPPVLISENHYLWSFLGFPLIYPHRKNVGEKHRHQWPFWPWNFRGEKRASELTRTIFPSWYTCHAPKCVPWTWKRAVSRCFQRKEHTWPADEVTKGWGEEGREHGANVSQPEPQNCDPPRRGLLEEKERKKVEWLLRDFVFCAHTSHSSSTGGSVQSTHISVLLNVKEGSTDHSLLFRNECKICICLSLFL